jgi:hypothetical protein
VTTAPPPVSPPLPAVPILLLWAALVLGPRIRESEGWQLTWAGLQVACLLPWWVGVEVWDRVRRR